MATWRRPIAPLLIALTRYMMRFRLSNGGDMRLFWEIVKLSLQRQLTYRSATVAGLITNVFFGLLRAVLLTALYAERDSVAGITLQDAITYTALSQAMIAYLMIFGWWEVMTSVYSGEIASDLLKPLNYFRFWLAQDLGRAAVALVLRGVSIVVIYALFLRISLPQSGWQWLALAVSLALAWLVSFAWRFLVNLSAFWTPDARGIGRFAFGIVWVLSGFYMPLRFFPEWFQTLCQATPFPAMLNTSVEIYLGLLTGPALVRSLLQQLLWAALLIAVAHWVLRAGVRSLVVQGG